jgi:hypothetical protein
LKNPKLIEHCKKLYPDLTDIPRIPGRCEAMLVPSGVLSNGKSHGACTAGGQNRQLPAPTR